MSVDMDIHRKSVDMDMDMDVKFHIHGNPGERYSSPAGTGGARPPNAFWCNPQPKNCKSVEVLPTRTKRPCHIFYDFLWNADSVRVVSSSSGSGQSHTENIIAFF